MKLIELDMKLVEVVDLETINCTFESMRITYSFKLSKAGLSAILLGYDSK